MNFHNQPVDVANLPAWEDVGLSPVSARYAPYRGLNIAGRWLLISLVIWLSPAVPGVPLLGEPAVAAGLALVGAIAGVFAWREARRRAWGLREHDLIYRSGILVHRTALLPLARIQHVETMSGPLERAFGLVRLICYTAGGRGADLVMAGLQADTAERIRQFLLEHIRDLDAAGEPDV